MIFERAKSEKQGVTQLMYVGDDPVPALPRTWTVIGVIALIAYMVLRKR